MKTKTKNKSTPENIKSKLNAILKLNAKRKAAIDKISKNISREKSKNNIDKINIKNK